MKFETARTSAFHARIADIDLSKPLGPDQQRELEHLLAVHGVISFARQDLTPAQFKHFASQFGELEVNVANTRHVAGFPEIMVLSNIVENGEPIGMRDAGQGWHTDLSYNKVIGYSTILYALEIPSRNGRSLGDTQFCNMHAAYNDLPNDLKKRLEGMTVLHDFDKFWEMMRRKGSNRPPLSPEQRKNRPPASHPIFLTHPVSGQKVLYADPGYSVKINELSDSESEEILNLLFQHQTQEKYMYSHSWSVGDVLMWDDMTTIHNAVSDYGEHDRRHLQRCQVNATRFF